MGTASEHLVDLLYERTGGNPFFVEELVGYLVESGALTMEGEVWDIPETTSLQMPDSVRVVVEERLERLDEETRKTLAMASVIGREFTLPLLQEVTGFDEESLVDTVDRAVEARVLVPGSSVGQEAYAFADNQVREVLYQDTGIARRRRYHLQVAEAIEKVHGHRLEEHYDALAHHFLEGNDLEKAADYSIKAGDLAWGQSVFPRAWGHYQVAAELLEELGEESERAAHVQARLGISLVSVSAVGVSSEGTRKGVQLINSALDTFVNLGNVRRAAELHRVLAGAYPTGGGIEQDYHEAGRHAQAAVDLLAGEEDSLENAMAHETLAFWYERCLDLDRAEELAREALRIAEAVQDPDAMTRACTTLGLVLVQRGHLDQGLSYAKRGLAAAQKARTPWFRERAAAFPIVVYPWLADVGHYLEWFTRWEDLQRQATIQRHQLEVLGVMAAISVQRGDPERAQDLLARIAQFGPDAAFEWHGAVLTARHYGQLLLDQGEPRRSAEELLEIQWKYCRERGAITFELSLLPSLCESYLRQGRLEEARASLGRAQEILAMPENWRGLTAGVALAGAMLATVEERWEEAEAGFQEATETNQRHGLLYDQAGVMFKWAVMYLDRSTTYPEPLEGRVSPAQDRVRGLELLEQSLAIFQRCDVKEDVERVVALQEQFQSQVARAYPYPDGLTQREVEVLCLVAAGKTNPEIAGDLFISASTVNTHVSNIFNKINAVNRAQAASYATREGLA